MHGYIPGFPAVQVIYREKIGGDRSNRIGFPLFHDWGKNSGFIKSLILFPPRRNRNSS
jgi:hypothetical protein